MQKDNTKFRHELKYVVSCAQLSLLKNRVHNLLSLDSHTSQSGVYNIRSLYFDDYFDTCMRQNEDGTDPREKFRIRIYNHSADHIKLECKRKERGKTHKTSCKLTEEQTGLLMQGKVIGDIESQPPLLRKLTCKMLTQGFKPKVIVEYDRVPYVYKNGNVRVTFDTNISSSTDIEHFLDEKIAKRPVMPVGKSLLEVKYDVYIPDFIYNNLQLQNLTQTAYSKYYICRKFTL